MIDHACRTHRLLPALAFMSGFAACCAGANHDIVELSDGTFHGRGQPTWAHNVTMSLADETVTVLYTSDSGRPVRVIYKVTDRQTSPL